VHHIFQQVTRGSVVRLVSIVRSWAKALPVFNGLDEGFDHFGLQEGNNGCVWRCQLPVWKYARQHKSSSPIRIEAVRAGCLWTPRD